MAKTDIKLNGIVVGFYDKEIIEQTPRSVRVFGSYDTTLAPKGGGGDALVAFQSRPKDNFGGRMHDAVMNELKDFYSKGINPQVLSIKIDMTPSGKGPVVNWEVYIGESRDNKAWVGFSSRGAAGIAGGANGAIKRAERQALQKKKDLPGEVGEKTIDMEFTDILDYRNTNVYIRQLFWTYTRPKGFPPKKGSNQAPETPKGAQGTQGAQDGLAGNKFDEVEPEPTPSSYFDETADPSSYAPDQEIPSPNSSLTSVSEDDVIRVSENQDVQFDEPAEVTEQEEGRGDRTGETGQKIKANEEKKQIKNIFPPKLKARTIKIDLPASDAYQKEFKESFSNFPILWYGTVQIQPADIINLNLSIESNLPTIRVKFNDSFGVMKDKGMPLDDTRIALFLGSRSQYLKPIHMDFKIVYFTHSGIIFDLVAVVDAPQLYIKKFKTYSNLSSFKLYQEIAKEADLGFNSNIDDTDDKMIWINTGYKVHEYMNKVIRHTYKSDETYLVQFIDFYYNLNYIDVEKEMKRDLKQELGIANVGIEEIVKIDPPDLVQRNFLSNAGGLENTNSYFGSYTVINNSTKLSILKGYLTKIKFYDQKKKSILYFDVDAITSSPDEAILLRGAPKEDEFFKENTNTEYAGKLDTDNVHQNYYYATIQNKINFYELSKIGIVVEVRSPNFNYYMYQKIIVHVSEQAPSPSRTEMNNRLTGEYLITDISFSFVGGVFKQTIQLNRRDLGLSPEEKKLQQFKDGSKEGGNSTDRGNNSNPIDQEQAFQSQPDGFSEPQPTTKAISKSSFPKGNILEIMKASTRHGITNVYSRKALLGVASKESPQLKPEISYANTSPDRIREVYPSKFGKMSDSEINRIKTTDEFWEIVYGGKFGNTNKGDGAKYRGRGFNQITFKSNYESLQREYIKQGSKLGAIDIVKNPQLLSEGKYAAEFYILFMIKSFGIQGFPINKFTDLKNAVFAFVRANAGWPSKTSGAVLQQGYSKAYAFASKLTDDDVKDSPAA